MRYKLFMKFELYSLIPQNRSPYSRLISSQFRTSIITLVLTDNRRTRIFLDRSFCINSGQIKSGKGVEDTFQKINYYYHYYHYYAISGIVCCYRNRASLLPSSVVSAVICSYWHPALMASCAVVGIACRLLASSVVAAESIQPISDFLKKSSVKSPTLKPPFEKVVSKFTKI